MKTNINELSESEIWHIVEWYKHPQVKNDVSWIQYALRELHIFVSKEVIQQVINNYKK